MVSVVEHVKETKLPEIRPWRGSHMEGHMGEGY